MRRLVIGCVAVWLAAGPGRAEEAAEAPPPAKQAPAKAGKPRKSEQWRGAERPSVAAKRLPKKEAAAAAPEHRPRFAPGKAAREDAPAKESAPPGAVDAEQWRKSPADRRWESWREFPAEKQLTLWRELAGDERDQYWAGMNVHERTTLWLKMNGDEKEHAWGRLEEADRDALCDGLPPNERAHWAPRLAPKTPAEAPAEGAKFKPAKPEPGYVPKSLYKNDDDLDLPPPAPEEQ